MPPYNIYGSLPYYGYLDQGVPLHMPSSPPQNEERRFNPMTVQYDELLDNRYYPQMQPNQYAMPFFPIHGVSNLSRMYDPHLQGYYPNIYPGLIPNYQQPNYIGPYLNRKYDTEQKSNIVSSIPNINLPHISNNSTPSGHRDVWETTNSKRPSPQGATYKPKKPKKNSKPRINTLTTIIPKEDYSQAEEGWDNYYIHFQTFLGIPEASIQPNLPSILEVKTELERKLFDLFIHEVSGCMDMFIDIKCFSEIVPKLALLDDTGMILNSIFTLSGLMLRRIDPNAIDESIAMKYYHQTIRSIRSYLSSNTNDDNGTIARCLLSTVMLCVYEMFFLATDNTYVKGSVSLLVSIITRLVDASPLTASPFLRMCFWATFTCDLILSLKFNLPTMFSVQTFWRQIDPVFMQSFDKPSTPNNSGLFLSRKEQVWWLHKALLHFSIINEFNHTPMILTQVQSENNYMFVEWNAINMMIEEFGSSMPLAMKPLIYKPGTDESPYPIIYYRDELSALVNLQYKLSQAALYQGLIQRTDVNSPQTQDILNKLPSNFVKILAKDIIGILKTYDLNLYLWPINIHTIRFIARYLHDNPVEYKQLESLMQRVIETCHFIFQSKGIIG